MHRGPEECRVGGTNRLSTPRPMAFLSDLATNMTHHGVSIVLYSGNDDSLIAHRGTEGACLSDDLA